uniref:Uncharacterized protein n=1 Tax=Vitis vinifera TaxID=29760 RepID=F6HNW6_VITVI
MVPNIFNDSESVLQFRRGFEEASKFLPNGNGLLLDLANHHTGLLSPEVAEERVKSCYHKDFMIDDEDGQWLRQGRKGRVTYAMSSWKPAY